MIYILLPAYNEEHSIDNFFNSIYNELKSADCGYKVLVCNDGSVDKTAEKIKLHSHKMPIEVISHKYNRGLGETIRDLFERVAEVSSADDIVIRMDCDDTHEPKYFKKLINKLDEGYDVAIASRFVKGGNQIGLNSYRSFISYSANLFMKIFFPISGIREYTCAFRAYRASVIKKAINFYRNDFVQLKGIGFTCTLEKMIKLKIIGTRFAEVPFVLRYDKKKSSSKMLSSLTAFGYCVMTVLCYWPWGGWKSIYNKSAKNDQICAE